MLMGGRIMKLREYLLEMTKYSREQKDDLCHVILNVLADPNTAKLLKKVRKSNGTEVIISKNEAEAILNNIKRIRQIILDLPMEG